ncbi:MAG: hypothetical protein ACR2PF_14065 [Rhizobiaceae bacterium]
MTSSFKQVCVAMLAGACALSAASAFAQSDPNAMRLLKRLYEKQGYSIESARREGGVIEAIACRGGKRAKITTSLDGEVIRYTETGKCTQREEIAPKREAKPQRDPKPQDTAGFTPQQAQTYLTNQGFEQIELYRENGHLQARACGDNRIHRFTVGRDGSIRTVRTKQRCRSSNRSEAVRFGPSKIEALLKSKGYDRIDVLQGQTAPYKARACLGTDRVEINIGRKGRLIDSSRVDGCLPAAMRGKIDRAQFRADGVARRLRRDGYNRIDLLAGTGFPYRVRACRGGDQIEMTIGRRGITDSSRIDGCLPPPKRAKDGKVPQFQPAEIEDVLLDEGFDRIAVIQGRRAPYKVRACRGRNRIELIIGKQGRIRDQRRVDGCAAPIDPSGLENHLRKNGFDRVKVVKRNQAPYAAEACRGRDHLRLVVGRYGEIERERRLGQCAGTLSEAGLRELLSKRGLIALSVDKRRRGWSADVCDGDKRVALRIGSRGRIRGEEVTGNCRSQTVREVLETLEDRGARRVSAFVEGCFKGKRYRWAFDRLGNRTGRERVGNCR